MCRGGFGAAVGMKRAATVMLATSLEHKRDFGLGRMSIRRLLEERTDGGRLRFEKSRRGSTRILPVDCGSARDQEEY